MHWSAMLALILRVCGVISMTPCSPKARYAGGHMADPSLKASYLYLLLRLFREQAAPERIRALLDEGQRAGVKPAGLYLSAMKLRPDHWPLPPNPRAVLEVPVALRRRHGAPDTLEGHPERGLVCARVLVLRARECGGMARRCSHGR